VYRSANVGMSNQTAPENGARRNTKVSWATEVVPGLVDPKANPKGVVDGKQVNIPVPKSLFARVYITETNPCAKPTG